MFVLLVRRTLTGWRNVQMEISLSSINGKSNSCIQGGITSTSIGWGLIHAYKYIMGGGKVGGTRLFYVVCRDKTRGNRT